MSGMTPAEFKMIRKGLGLTPIALSRLAGVSERTVQNWDSGRFRVPDDVVDLLAKIGAYLDEYVMQSVEALEVSATLEGKDQEIVVYRTDSELWDALPDFYPIPANVHCQALYRIHAQLKSRGIKLLVTYPADNDQSV